MQEEVPPLLRKVRGAEHVDTVVGMTNLAPVHSQLGRHSEAVSLQEQVVAGRRKGSGSKHPATIWAVIHR